MADNKGGSPNETGKDAVEVFATQKREVVAGVENGARGEELCYKVEEWLMEDGVTLLGVVGID